MDIKRAAWEYFLDSPDPMSRFNNKPGFETDPTMIYSSGFVFCDGTIKSKVVVLKFDI
jgi:hypothetical protein